MTKQKNKTEDTCGIIQEFIQDHLTDIKSQEDMVFFRSIIQGYWIAIRDMAFILQRYIKENSGLRPSQKDLVEDFAEFTIDFMSAKHKNWKEDLLGETC